MQYEINTWTISDIRNVYQQGQLDLNPPYQRKFIWSLSDQQTLIDSLIKNYPIPNIFLYHKRDGNYEMVDGQQRSRTILAFLDGEFTTFDGIRYSIQALPNFILYSISVIVIRDLQPDDITIEEFYTLVNSAGVHLNRPELKKAEYFNSNFLKLVTECNDLDSFKALGLFTESVAKRMSDLDLVSELVTQLKEGITDKKETVDKLYELGLSEEDYQNLLRRFTEVVSILNGFNDVFHLKKTRYRQRNDLYTLFGFINNNISLERETLIYFYKLLVCFAEDIYPSNEDCLVFQTYARNCVTQSNSKASRLERLSILNSLFLNESPIPNSVQNSIVQYYEIADAELITIEGKHTINLNRIADIKPNVVFNG